MDWGHAQKNAIKMAIAAVAACTIALALNWENPAWAGFAVIFPRMSYAGMTLHRSILYIFGSVAGILAALAILATVSQSPWIALLLLAIWFGGCTFAARRLGTNYGVFIAGVIAIIVYTLCIFHPENAYQIAYYRLAETCLGLTVGTLVNGLIWPELELPTIGQKLEVLRSKCIEYQRALADWLGGDEQAPEQLDTVAREVGALYAEIEELFVSVRRNTLAPSCLIAPSLLFFESRVLVRRLFALRELLKSYLGVSHAESSPWFIEWLRTEVSHLESMDWQHMQVRYAAMPREETSRIRAQVDQYITDKIPQLGSHLEAITTCVAAKDILLSISDASETVAEVLQADDDEVCCRLEQHDEVIGVSPPEESLATDARKGFTAFVSIMVVGTIWYASQLQAWGVAVLLAAIVQMVYATSRVLPVRACLAGLVLGWVWAMVTLLVFMPQLNGIAQLAIALFIPVFAIELVKEVPKYKIWGLCAFVAFISLLALQDQEPSFIVSSQSFFDSMAAQLVGVGSAIFVIKLLNPSSAGQELRRRTARVIREGLRLLSFNDRHANEPYSATELGLDLRRAIKAIDVANFWRQVAAHTNQLNAARVMDLLQSLRAAAFTISRLEQHRGTNLGSLPEQMRAAELNLHQRLESSMREMELSIEAQTASDASKKLESFGKELDEFAIDNVHVMIQRHDAHHELLSLLGHYHAAYTTLQSVSTAIDLTTAQSSYQSSYQFE